MKQRHSYACVRLASLCLVGMALVFAHARTALGVEVGIGEATIPPGVTLVFEGAMPDDITPHAQNLAQEKTDVHLEVRANWATEGAVPDGAPRGGFVAYLNMHAQVENEQTGQVIFVTLIPHLVLGDSFHYARNVALPGGTHQRYTITFLVNPPDLFALAFHSNWREQVGSTLIQEHVFTFHGVDFSAVVER
jgi:periplasmic iron binding protein